MKKALCVLLTFLLVFLYGSALTEETTPEKHVSGYFTYIILEDGTAEIIEHDDFNDGEFWSTDTVIIPSELDGIPVSSINYDVASWDHIKAIIIPDGITSVGDMALSLSKGITEIFFPDSISYIGMNPFVSCENLTTINVSPDHSYLAIIEGVLFSKPDKRLICYPCAFTATEYEIPQGIKVIGGHAFQYNKALTKITIPDGVTVIGDRAFFGCSNLASLKIPESVSGIEEGAFYTCINLSSINIPDGITDIGYATFYLCRNLTSIELPKSLKSIGNRAFLGCSGLTNIAIPDTVEFIGSEAFADCYNLTLIVGRDSYAKQYCIDNNIKYMYPDSNDWLNN